MFDDVTLRARPGIGHDLIEDDGTVVLHIPEAIAADEVAAKRVLDWFYPELEQAEEDGRQAGGIRTAAKLRSKLGEALALLETGQRSPSGDGRPGDDPPVPVPTHPPKATIDAEDTIEIIVPARVSATLGFSVSGAVFRELEPDTLGHYVAEAIATVNRQLLVESDAPARSWRGPSAELSAVVRAVDLDRAEALHIEGGRPVAMPLTGRAKPTDEALRDGQTTDETPPNAASDEPDRLEPLVAITTGHITAETATWIERRVAAEHDRTPGLAPCPTLGVTVHGYLVWLSDDEALLAELPADLRTAIEGARQYYPRALWLLLDSDAAPLEGLPHYAW